MIDWKIVEEPITRLADHARLPISFVVDRRIDVDSIALGVGGIAWREAEVAPPFLKDYDAVADDAPTRWPGMWVVEPVSVYPVEPLPVHDQGVRRFPTPA